MAMSDELCRDFDKGKCSRGDRCKFFHPKLQICKDFQNKKCEREKCRFLHVTREEEESYENSGIFPDHIDEEEAKKKRIMNTSYGGGGQDFGGMYGKRYREDGFNDMSGISAIPTELMDENKMLNHKVMELQQQVMDLRQMNDTLYDQNTNYRNQIRGTAGGAQQTPSLTSVGVTDLAANRNYYDFTSAGR